MYQKFNSIFTLIFLSVRKQLVDIPSYVVRMDSQKYIDFAPKSPYGGGRPGRVKRRNQRIKYTHEHPVKEEDVDLDDEE